jgi:DNA-directed RNA polymerase alpha subunit
MITEKKYKNALSVIKQYEEQQAQLKKEKIFQQEITLKSVARDLWLNNIISYRLFNRVFCCEYFRGARPLSEFTTLTKAEVSKYSGIGKATVDEFINIMAAAGHIVL